MRIHYLLAAALAVAVHPAISAAAPLGGSLVVPVHQDRSIGAHAATDDVDGGAADSDGASAPGFGQFQRHVTALAESENAAAATDAWQDSRILPSGLTLAGGTETQGCGGGLFGATVSGEGTSYFDVRFTLTASATFMAVGSVGADAGEASLRLRTVGGALVFEAATTGSAVVPVDESGVLPAGDYRMIAAANVDDWGKCIGGSADFSLELVFELAEIGATYCSPAVPNSTGQPGAMRVGGSTTVADDDLVLIAESLPTDPNIGYFIMGTGTNTFTPPGSAGPICVAPGIQRYLPPVNNTSEMGGGFMRVVGTSGPVSGLITPGSTWNFQAWHRDGMNPSNLTDAVSVSFD